MFSMLSLVTLNVIGWVASYIVEKKFEKEMQDLFGNSEEMTVIDKDGTEIKIKQKKTK